jgi:hypothetical protein
MLLLLVLQPHQIQTSKDVQPFILYLSLVRPGTRASAPTTTFKLLAASAMTLRENMFLTAPMLPQHLVIIIM